MKKVFDILHLWFLASCCASFFAIIGSVVFVLVIGNLLAPSGFRNDEALLGGFCIATLASGICCLFLLLPFVVIRNLADDVNDYGFACWVTGLPSILMALFLSSLGNESVLIILSVTTVIFGFLGGWIFGRIYEVLYDRMLDARNAGFFEMKENRIPQQ